MDDLEQLTDRIQHMPDGTGRFKSRGLLPVLPRTSTWVADQIGNLP